MNLRRVRGLFPFLVVSFVVLGTIGTVHADPVFQQQYYVQLLSADPVDLQLRSFQNLPREEAVEATSHAATVIQSLGKPSAGSLQIERFIRNPDHIFVQPVRDSVGVNAVVAAPEPATMVLLGSGLAGVAGFVRRRSRKSQID